MATKTLPAHIALSLLLGCSVCGAADGKFSAKAKELVRAVRAQEAWIDDVDSLSIRYEGEWKHSERAIAARKAKLQKQFPDSAISPKQFSELRPVMRDSGHLAFDSSRLRRETQWEDVSNSLHIWNGEQLFVHDEYLQFDEKHCVLFSDPKHAGDSFWRNLSWPHVAPHSFWFRPQTAGDYYEMHLGSRNAPEDFVVGGEEEYRGHDCHVLQFAGANFVRWYVDVESGRLRGYMTGRWYEGRQVEAELEQFARKLAASNGKTIASSKKFWPWLQSMPQSQRAEIEREYFARVNERSVPLFEYVLDDFQEVTPGGWVPMKQELFVYSGSDAQGNAVTPYVATHKTFRFTEVRINEQLPDNWFKTSMEEGVKVVDRRHDWMAVYSHKKNRTEAEWDAIMEKARKDNEESERLQQEMDALIGQDAPSFSADATWVNGEPRTWQSLRGKVVLIDFWAHWCSPCRDDFPTLAALHKHRAEHGITVIGIHVAGGKRDSIENVARKYEMSYPTCIDIPATGKSNWGHLFASYRVGGIPHSFVVDADGKIAAHGSLGESLDHASELVKKTSAGTNSTRRE